MGLTPLHDRVLVKPSDASAMTPSGLLHIPETVQDKANTGTVIATGKGRITPDGRLIPISVKHGDTVMYGKHAGTELKIEGVEHLLMSEDEIIGVIS